MTLYILLRYIEYISKYPNLYLEINYLFAKTYEVTLIYENYLKAMKYHLNTQGYSSIISSSFKEFSSHSAVTPAISDSI
jgi:hypothetical protein